MSSILEELKDATEGVLKLHNQGCIKARELHGIVSKELTPSDIASVIIRVSEMMRDYNLLHRIYPVKLDFTKVLTFTAAALKEKMRSEYSAVPLFYAYIGFLDDTYIGTGMTLRSFGESIFYAENLEMMLQQENQWLAPFCYFRAIDLSFDKCAIPVVESLLNEIDQLKLSKGGTKGD